MKILGLADVAITEGSWWMAALPEAVDTVTGDNTRDPDTQIKKETIHEADIRRTAERVLSKRENKNQYIQTLEKLKHYC